MERWYRQGVVVIWPRDRYFRILAGEGPAHAIPALEKLVDPGAPGKPDEDAACRDFAREIIDRWAKPKHRREEGSLATRMLKLLDRIGEGELAARFVRDILPGDCDGTEGPVLSRIGNRFGWANLGDPLFDFFSRQSPEEHSSALATPVSVFEALCCSPPALTDERRSVCSVLAGELEQLIERWDGYRGHAWYREEEGRAGIVESVCRAFHALGEHDRLERFIAHVLANPKRYDLHKVLIPAVKSIHRSLRGDSARQKSFDHLRNHCLTELRTRTAKPIEPPADWSRDAEINCTCADCRELVRFMRDPDERVHRFPRRKDLRQHLHQQIDANRLDLTHVTERKGSPQTLVCTKTQASYERRLAQFRVDSQLLEELERLTGGAARPAAPAARRRSKVKAARRG